MTYDIVVVLWVEVQNALVRSEVAESEPLDGSTRVSNFQVSNHIMVMDTIYLVCTLNEWSIYNDL